MIERETREIKLHLRKLHLAMSGGEDTSLMRPSFWAMTPPSVALYRCASIRSIPRRLRSEFHSFTLSIYVFFPRGNLRIDAAYPAHAISSVLMNLRIFQIPRHRIIWYLQYWFESSTVENEES